MKTWAVYKLKFRDGFHVSSGGFGMEKADTQIRSDTLLGAIVFQAVRVFKNRELGVDSNNVSVSSTFPYFGTGEATEFFLPRPLGWTPSGLPERHRKTFQKMRYLSHRWLQRLVATEPSAPTSWFPARSESELRLVHGCWFSEQVKEPPRVFMKMEDRPHVSLDRISRAPNVFSISEVRFHPDAGLFFIAKFSDEQTQLKFEAILEFLSDTGIGADRTVGKGIFTFESVSDFPTCFCPTADNPLWEQGKTQLLLSLYHPTSEEQIHLNFRRSQYDIETRRGWATTPSGMTLRKAALRLLREGSVLYYEKAEPLKGSWQTVLEEGTVNLTHPVQRNVQALTIPIPLTSGTFGRVSQFR